MLIGQFTRHKTGYGGRIHTLFHRIEVVLVPAEASDVENAPDFRIHLDNDDGPEVGAAWNRISERAGNYVSLLLEDPTLAHPFRAHLFQSGDDKANWALHWSRPTKRDERG